MQATKEINYGKQLSELAESMKGSTKMFSSLVMEGYRSDDLEALDKFITGLTNAMEALTKLIHDQAKMVETAIVLKNIGGNN